MDASLRQTFGKIDFHTSITQVTTDNIVMWVTKTQILLATLRTQNQPRKRFYVFLEVEQLSPSVGYARSQRQSPTVPLSGKIISLDAGLRMDGFLALDLCGDRSVAFN